MKQMNVDLHRMRSKAPILLQRFEQAKVSDKAAEAEAKKLGCTAGVFALFIVAACAFAFWMTAEKGTPLGWLLPLPLLIASIYFAILASKAKKLDLDDLKLDTVVQLLRMLSVDTPASALLRLKVDFRDYQKGGVLDSKDGNFMNQRVYKYSHEWLSLEGSLADGNAYLLSATDSVTRKEKPKRKYTKVKESRRATIALQLKLKPGRYGSPERIVSTLESLPPPAPLTVKSVSARGRTLRVAVCLPPSGYSKARYGTTEFGTDNALDGDKLLKAFLWAYDGLAKAPKAAA